MADQLFQNIYRGRKVFITGHTGFKGSWLSLWLSQLGANVIGYSIGIPTNPSHFELLKLNCTSIIEDVLHKEKLAEAIQTHQPDIVFHMAAQPLVRKSYQDPVLTFETNIIGSANLLESCRQAGKVRAIVNITSDKCYQNNELDRGYREDDPMGGDDPYSASKGAAEIVSQAYRHSFFNPVDYGRKHHTLLANVRAGNVIGGGDWADDRLIPDIVRATSRGETMVVRHPHSVRPWQHILEPLSGYLHLGWKLLEGRPEFSDNWNFGPDDQASLTVQQVIEETKKYWPDVNYRIVEDPDNVHETKVLKLDSSKAKSQLKWKNVWDNDTTFKKTISWYKQYYHDGSVTSLKDVSNYIADAQRAGVEWAVT